MQFKEYNLRMMRKPQIPIAKCVAWFNGGALPDRYRQSTLSDFEVLSGTPDISFINRRNKRRLSTMARAVLYCAQKCISEEVEPRIVYSSRHGETKRTYEMLIDLARGEELSPTDFSLSVHNSTAGILSISKGNTLPITALASGDESFGWGLVEAFLMWKNLPTSPVLYLFCDDHLPEQFSTFEEPNEQLHAVAILIGEAFSLKVSPNWQQEEKSRVPGKPLSIHFLDELVDPGSQRAWQGRRLMWGWEFD